jgi:hypothetical protein
MLFASLTLFNALPSEASQPSEQAILVVHTSWRPRCCCTNRDAESCSPNDWMHAAQAAQDMQTSGSITKSCQQQQRQQHSHTAEHNFALSVIPAAGANDRHYNGTTKVQGDGASRIVLLLQTAIQ